MTAAGRPVSVTRLAVVDPGDVGLAVIRAAREYAIERRRALRVVALHLDDEAGNLWVREADETVPVSAWDDDAAVERALRTSAVDAIWDGAGSIDSQLSFAEACAQLGVALIGAARPVNTADVHTSGGRHVDVHAMVDMHGTARAIGVTEHSAVGSDVIELAHLSPEVEAELADEARSIIARSSRAGACTLTFCVDGGGHPVLQSVHPGLGAGHTILEMTTGIDLVKLQLQIAEGARLDEQPPASTGHAIAVTVHIKSDEWNTPCASRQVLLLRLPGGTGIKVDRGAAEGDFLAMRTGGPIATLTACGHDRAEAVVRMQRALTEMTIIVAGAGTNRGALLEQISPATTESRQATTAVPALLAAAIDVYNSELMSAHAAFFAAARRGRPQTASQISRRAEFRDHSGRHVLDVSRIGPTIYRVRMGGRSLDVQLRNTGRFESRLTLAGRDYRVLSNTTDTCHNVEVDGTAHVFVRDDGRVVRSATPGVIVSVCVAPGDRIEPDSAVAVVESMKLETVVTAHTAGRVRQVLVGANQQVSPGTVLVRLDSSMLPDAQVDEAPMPIDLPAPAARCPGNPCERCDANLVTLSNLLLGYDVDPAEARAAIADETAVCLAVGTDPNFLQREIRLVFLFADLRLLFRNQHEMGEHDVRARSPEEWFFAYLRSLDPDREGLPAYFVSDLRRALAHYEVQTLTPSPQLQDALYWMFQSQLRVSNQLPVVVAVLERWLHADWQLPDPTRDVLRDCLDHLVAATTHRYPVIADLARDVKYHQFDEALLDQARRAELAEMDRHLASLGSNTPPDVRTTAVNALVACPQPLAPVLLARMPGAIEEQRWVALEIMTRRYYRMRALAETTYVSGLGETMLASTYDDLNNGRVHLLAATGSVDELPRLISGAAAAATELEPDETTVIDLYTWSTGPLAGINEMAANVGDLLDRSTLPPNVRRVVVVAAGPGSPRMSSTRHYTFRPTADGFVEDDFLRGLHPLMATRLGLSRLRNFTIERLPAADDVYLFRARARDNIDDERLLAFGEVRDLTTVRDECDRVVALPQFERVLLEAIAGIRNMQAPLAPERRLHWNRIVLHVWPPVLLGLDDIHRVAHRLAPAAEGLGLERIEVQCRRPDPVSGELRDRVLRVTNPTGAGFVLTEVDQHIEPLQPLDDYTRKVVQARRRGTAYPYEIIEMVTAPHAGQRDEIAGGSFIEYDLDGERLVPVDRPFGCNSASIVVGVARNVTMRYPEGMARVTLLGDPTRALGSLAEPECQRIIAALDLADELGIPVDWFALSAGAKISMDIGTEGMDRIAAVLKRIVLYTQGGGEINVVVTGINVGAQPYWNAEATMLMHTHGILVMTPESAMVLTGKQALEYSGGVSAEDNFGIGGYERIMGPNGQAQYWAPDLDGAIGVLLAHHAHTYVAPGERFPRQESTLDPADRDVRDHPHAVEGSPFTTVGDIFSEATNPDRKLAFDMRTVMAAVADQDLPTMERWPAMRDADTVIVWDAHLGGYSVALLGVESRPLSRRGPVPADGPDSWSSGTLFPLSAKKMARAINSASGNRPLVVLANLSGFDGSPDSMRSLQLEYGAEIGRAVVNFDGPIVFCVISRYHGGAFVVFSQALNEGLETIAVEGSRASVIGGAPAAAVVFASEVHNRAKNDFRVIEMEELVAKAEGAERARLRARLADVTSAVRSEKLGEVASEFDQTHSVERALRVGSVRSLVSAAELRPALIAAVERGMRRQRSHA